MSLRSTGTLVTFSALTVTISLAIAGEPMPAARGNRSFATSSTVAPPISRAMSSAPPVFNCADAGAGSLRAAVAGALSGDTIDMTHLLCSTITTSTGEIIVAVDDLFIIGPGPRRLAIENNSDPNLTDSRLFNHQGHGTLSLSGLSVNHGHGKSAGGCIRSQGSVALKSVELFGCSTIPVGNDPGFGGGISAVGDVTMRSSDVYHSAVVANGYAYGGCVFAGGNFFARDSYLSYCQSQSHSSSAVGGAAFIRGDTDIERVSIFHNYSGTNDTPGDVGGAVFAGSTRIVNSVVANNQAYGVNGGIYAAGQRLTLHSSTISGNTAKTSAGANNAQIAAGVYLSFTTLDLKSTIIANNTFGNGNLFDLSGVGSVVSGSHNLVTGSAIAPPDTLIADPKLGPPEAGHLITAIPLLPGSPAIDHGSNSDALATDARGAGFPRIVGNAPDIGAYEVQAGSIETIFADGFN